MSEKKPKRDDEEARGEALFRFRVLVPLLEEHAELSLRERIAQCVTQVHRHPYRGDPCCCASLHA